MPASDRRGLLWLAATRVYQMTQQRWSPEPTRIDIHADHELRYWSERFGVPKDEIEAAVKRVGPRVEDVAEEVGLLYA